jgi:hypothetical protein
MVELLRHLKAQIVSPASRPFVRRSCRRLRAITFALLLLSIAIRSAAGADARFDLLGPRIEVRVTRAGVTLPIASVPNLQPGDRLWLHPDLPATQSVHYLLVLAFLRGTTNPPPDSWFIRIQAWDKKVRDEGVEITVPDEAQQAVLFLAPATGGDFSTLRSAVQGRPGIFVRASQDLDLAGFEQARIEKYIASMRQVPIAETTDPKTLQEHSTLIASTLALKPNAECMKLSPDQQYTCLTQSGGQTLLDDGHGQSIVDALSNGPGSDFINQASYTQLAGAGVYSAYVGAIVDLVRIMGSLHTAQYQYIPAIAFPQQQSLNLRLNTPPSFHNPKSVIVIGLPSVQSTIAPPLRPADPSLVSCLARPGVVLPVEGAPLVFSTAFAHDLVLHLNYPASVKPDPAKPDAAPPQDIPLTADAYKGGLVLAPIPKRRPLPLVKVSLPTLPAATGEKAEQGTAPEKTDAADATGLTGTIQGFWGFDPFTGPTMALENTPGKDWKLMDAAPLIAGKDQQLLLASTGTACIQGITLDPAQGKSEKETWKPAAGPNTVDVALKLSALPGHDPGTLHLSIRQFGVARPDTVSLVSYSEPAKLTALEFHSGDTSATLTGSSLEEVRQVEFGNATFTPEPEPDSKAGLRLTLPAGATAPTLAAGDKLAAQVTLKDGRTLTLPLTVVPARPAVILIGKSDVPPESAAKPGLAIQLASTNDLPITDALLFSLKSAQTFPRAGKIEIASLDDSLHATLSVSSDSLILEDPHTILAKLEPLKLFGPSAYGVIRLRAVAPDGATGDWLPLVTLVRLPTLSGLSCTVAALTPAAAPDPAAHPTPCTLTGSSLYLIDALATDPAFTNPTRVPEGFVGGFLTLPAPTGALYYLRLRDDPTAANTITLPAGPL